MSASSSFQYWKSLVLRILSIGWFKVRWNQPFFAYRVHKEIHVRHYVGEQYIAFGMRLEVVYEHPDMDECSKSDSGLLYSIQADKCLNEEWGGAR